MAWITLTEANVLAHLNDAETDTYRNRIADGQADPLTEIIADTTSEVRGYCLRQVPTLPATGIPPSLKNVGLDIIIYRLAKRIQTASEAQRKPAYDDAIRKLEMVANGKLLIEDVDATVPGTGRWGSRPIITEPPHPDGAAP
jgi:phage gp36-like protein